MKKELTLQEFMRHCGQLSGVRFYYASSRQKNAELMRFSISFPPPDVFPNIETVCFSDAVGSKMMFSCVKGVRWRSNGKSGIDRCRFICRREDGEEPYEYEFCVF